MAENKQWIKKLFDTPELKDSELRKLYKFYLQNDNIYKILPIITSNSHISIRVLDWFVTNYSKKNRIIYELDCVGTNEDIYFNVYEKYKCQLTDNGKKSFDPFCRKERINFQYEEKKIVCTTIAQLNFFRWALKYGILQYVDEHLAEITADMIETNKKKNECSTHSATNSATNSVTHSAANIMTTRTSETQSICTIEPNESVCINTKTKNMASTLCDEINISTLCITSPEVSAINESVINESVANESVINESAANESVTNTSTTANESERKRKKRQPLSINANKNVNVRQHKLIFTFDCI